MLTDWIVAAAMAAGYPVQSTSIPGVAQRTGATTYYIEVYPEPADTLDGRTPNEVYFSQRPAQRRPRIETRMRWPRASRCARPQTLVAGNPGDRFTIDLDYHRGRKHLPIVSLKRVA